MQDRVCDMADLLRLGLVENELLVGMGDDLAGLVEHHQITRLADLCRIDE